MHSRDGLDTAYLGDEFMEVVKRCADKAKDENMLACLYDEDRYSSGFAGGLLTKNRRYSERQLLFTREKKESTGLNLLYTEIVTIHSGQCIW